MIIIHHSSRTESVISSIWRTISFAFLLDAPRNVFPLDARDWNTGLRREEKKGIDAVSNHHHLNLNTVTHSLTHSPCRPSRRDEEVMELLSRWLDFCWTHLSVRELDHTALTMGDILMKTQAWDARVTSPSCNLMETLFDQTNNYTHGKEDLCYWTWATFIPASQARTGCNCHVLKHELAFSTTTLKNKTKPFFTSKNKDIVMMGGGGDVPK